MEYPADEIDVKRFYMDAQIPVTCKCGAELELDLSDQYLSYPVVGQTQGHGAYCEACGDDVEVNILIKKITLDLEIV
jgi:hypothetical protein